jgi:ABC-type proline/glycine betaine transport system ATPase subunit
MQPTINITMPPLLIKFLKYKQAITPQEPLRFPKQHFVNKFLKAHLINIDSLNNMPINEKENVQQYYKPQTLNSQLSTLNSQLSIAIPSFSSWKNHHKKRFITIKKKQLFVKTVKAIYKYEFEQFYWQHFKERKSKQKIANLWLEALHVDDEILPKSQWRAIYREIAL